jgi:teichuronic acid biosynthesis glycosyltransferase TuaC
VRVLAVTNLYPTLRYPTCGTFIEQQVNGLRQIGEHVEVMFVDRISKGVSAYFDLRHRLSRQVDQLQPDLIHAMYGGVMAYEVMKSVTTKPTIVTFHGSDLLGENLSGNLRKIISRCGVRASWSAARRATGVVTVSERLRDCLPADVDRKKVEVIPCGISLDLFVPLNKEECRNKLGWRTDRFHILFAANTGDPVKRPELAQAAVDTVARMGIHAEMHYLRGVPYEHVPVWLNASDTLLLTSRHEGSPTIVKEALACNLPIVSVDVGDVMERVRAIAGCYIASCDPADLADKLAMVYRGLRSVTGREKIRELSLAVTARRLQEFYRRTLTSFATFHPNVATDQHSGTSRLASS